MDNLTLRQKIKKYATSSYKKAWIQIINTVLPYIAMMAIMMTAMHYQVNYIFIFLMTIPTGVFMVRVFILFHDCTHLSFFKSKRANQIAGHIFGTIVFTTYAVWQSEHNKHHGSVGDLDRRGTGDVWTLTVEEYLEQTAFKKFVYRFYRNPIFLFFIAPFFLFSLLHRLPSRKFKTRYHHLSSAITNLSILAIFLTVTFALGLKYYLLIQLPVLYVASVTGVWLFFVQHQFEEVYWQHHEEWDFMKAALKGSSFYKLPLVLDWITGHIGFHHIHHLNARIPNYNLRKCFREVHELGEGKTITLLKSFRLALLTLYDEKSGKLIKVRDLNKKKIIYK